MWSCVGYINKIDLIWFGLRNREKQPPTPKSQIMKYCEMCMTVPASIINLKLHLIIQIVHISKKNQEYSLFFKLLNC